MKIKDIEKRSIAADSGLKAGDDLVKINGHNINDIIDYKFHSGDENIEFLAQGAGSILFGELAGNHWELDGKAVPSSLEKCDHVQKNQEKEALGMETSRIWSVTKIFAHQGQENPLAREAGV